MTKTFPKFEVTPDHVIFKNFQECCSYTQRIRILNQDQSAHQINVKFENNANLSVKVDGDQRVAPGLTIVVDLLFRPKISSQQMTNDERYEIHLISEHANYKYTIPIIILSTYPTINFPKEIVMPTTSPFMTTYSTMFVCNFGKIPYKFSFEVQEKTFHIRPCVRNINIKAGDHRIFIFEYTPKRSGKIKELVKVNFENNITQFITVKINSFPCDISLSQNFVGFADTFYGMTNDLKLSIMNNSTADVSFQWCNHKHSKRDVCKDRGDNADLFRNDAFKITPLAGKVIGGSTFPVTISFTPTTNNEETHELDDCTKYLVKAYLKTSTETFFRSKLYLQGVGRGPVIKLNYNTIVVGQLFMGEKKIFNIECNNIGLVPGRIRYDCTDEAFGGIVNVRPAVLTIERDQKRYFKLEYSNFNVGKFLEQIYFQVDYGERIKVLLTGEIMELTVRTYPEVIEFGDVPICVPQVQYIYIKNPLPCTLKIKLEFERQGTEDPLCFEELLIKPVETDGCSMLNEENNMKRFYISDTKLCDDVLNRDIPILRPTISAVIAMRFTMDEIFENIRKYLQDQDVDSTIACTEYALKEIMANFYEKVDESDIESGIIMATRLWRILLDNMLIAIEHKDVVDLLINEFLNNVEDHIRELDTLEHLAIILANETIQFFMDKIALRIESKKVTNVILEQLFDQVMRYFEAIDIVGIFIDDFLDELIEKYVTGGFRELPEEEPGTFLDKDWILSESPEELKALPEIGILSSQSCMVFEVTLTPNFVGKALKTLLIRMSYQKDEEIFKEEIEEEMEDEGSLEEEIAEVIPEYSYEEEETKSIETELDTLLSPVKLTESSNFLEDVFSSINKIEETLSCDCEEQMEDCSMEEEMPSNSQDSSEINEMGTTRKKNTIVISPAPAYDSLDHIGAFDYANEDENMEFECLETTFEDEIIEQAVFRVPVKYNCVIPHLKLDETQFKVCSYVETDTSITINITNDSPIDCFLNNIPIQSNTVSNRVEPEKYQLKGNSSVELEYILNSEIVGDFISDFYIMVLGLVQPIPITVHCTFLAPEIDYSLESTSNKLTVLTPFQNRFFLENMSPTIVRFHVQGPNIDEIDICPRGGQLAPCQGVMILLRMLFTDPGDYKHYLNIQIRHLKALRIPMKSSVRGSPFVFTPPIENVLNFGTIFLSRDPQSLAFDVRNFGKYSYSLVVSPLKGKQADNFFLEPSKMQLASKTSAELTAFVNAKAQGTMKEEFVFEAIKLKTTKRLFICKSNFLANVVAPHFAWSCERILLNIYDDGISPSYSYENIYLYNKTELDINVNCLIEGEFILLSVNSFLPQNTLPFSMKGKGNVFMTVCFNTSLVQKYNRYMEFTGKLKVCALGQCYSTLHLKACVFYPVLCISENVSDFLTNLLPFQFNYILHNPGPLLSSYEIQFQDDGARVIKLDELKKFNVCDELLARKGSKSYKDIYFSDYLSDDVDERLKLTLFNEDDDVEEDVSVIEQKPGTNKPKKTLKGKAVQKSVKKEINSMGSNPFMDLNTTNIQVSFDDTDGERRFEDVIMSYKKITIFLLKGDIKEFEEQERAKEEARAIEDEIAKNEPSIGENADGNNIPTVSTKSESSTKSATQISLQRYDGVPEGELEKSSAENLGKPEDYFDVSAMQSEMLPNYSRLLAFNFKKTVSPVLVSSIIKIDVRRGQSLFIDLTVTNSRPNLKISNTNFDLGIRPWFDIVKRNVVVSNLGIFPFYLSLSFDKYSNKDKRLIEGFVRKPTENDFFLDGKGAPKNIQFFSYPGIVGKFSQDVGVIANCDIPINLNFSGSGKIPFVSILNINRVSLLNMDLTFSYSTLREVFNKEIDHIIVTETIISDEEIIKYKEMLTNLSIKQSEVNQKSSKSLKGRKKSKSLLDDKDPLNENSSGLLNMDRGDQAAHDFYSESNLSQRIKFTYGDNGSAMFRIVTEEPNSAKLIQAADDDLLDFVVLDYPEEYPNVIELTNMMESYGFTKSLYTSGNINHEFRQIAKKYSLQKLSVNEIQNFGKPDQTMRSANFRIQALPFLVSEYQLDFGEIYTGEKKTMQFPLYYHGPGKMKIAVRSTVSIPGLRLSFIKPSNDYLNIFTVFDYPHSPIPEKDECGDYLPNIQYLNMHDRESLSPIPPKKCDIKHAHSFDFNTCYIHTRDDVTTKSRAAVIAHYNSISQKFKNNKMPFTLCEIFQERTTINNKFLTLFMEYAPIEKYYADETEVDDYLILDMHLGPSIPVHITAKIMHPIVEEEEESIIDNYY